MEKEPYLSVIVPAYKEGERIGASLLEMEKYFSKKTYTYEIVVIVDGSPDNTAEVARNYGSQVKNLRVIENAENHGKGYVVRQGLLEAKGKYRLFTDADGSTAITHLDVFLPEMEKEGRDVVIGSRDIPGAFIQIHQAKYKEIFGDTGNWLIRIVLGLWSFPDTQCGFKLVRAEVAERVAKRMVVDRFGFDFELIILAKKLGYNVVQLPVRWMNEEGSTVKLFGSNGYVQVMIDLLKTRWRILTGAYNLKEYKNNHGVNNINSEIQRESEVKKKSRILVIKSLEGDGVLATVSSNLDGTFSVESGNSEAKAYFFSLIHKIAEEHPKLSLRSGGERIENGQKVFVTISKNIANAEIDYLDALWDYFNHRKSEYLGKDFRVYTQEVEDLQGEK